MRCAVGVTVRTTAGCPHLRGAVVDIEAQTLVRTFQHKASSAAAAEQIHQLAQDFSTELAAQEVLAVVIREVGFHRAAGNTAAVKNRMRAEGACIEAARSVTANVTLLDANGIAHLFGVATADLDNAGGALAEGDWVECATAGLAAARLADPE